MKKSFSQFRDFLSELRPKFARIWANEKELHELLVVIREEVASEGYFILPEKQAEKGSWFIERLQQSCQCLRIDMIEVQRNRIYLFFGPTLSEKEKMRIVRNFSYLLEEERVS